MTAANAGGARRGRHRSAAADEAILSATLDLLRCTGYAGLTMQAVIERSGVSSATLYRRWPAKHELVAAAVASLAPEQLDIDTGTLEGDLLAFARHLAHTLEARGNLTALLALDEPDAALADALRAKLLEPRLDALGAILRRAVARGELASAPSPAMALPLLVGPLHYRLQILGDALSPAFVRLVARTAAAGLRSQP